MKVDSEHTARYRETTTPVGISNKFKRDRVGNLISSTDGRGIRTDYAVNQLNQIVEITTAASVSETTENNLNAFAYKNRFFYDHNDNVIRTEQEYRDGNNDNLPGFIEAIVEFNIFDQPISTQQRIDNNTTITTIVGYDRNQNRDEVLTPLATSGNQPGNKTKIIYDERDLPFQLRHAPGTEDVRIETINYDQNGNISTFIDAKDNSGDGNKDVTTYTYDGFNRLISVVDAVGNKAEQKYDPVSNIIESSLFGPVGGESRSTNDTSGNILLAKTRYSHDELSRAFQTDQQLFTYAEVQTERPVILNENDFIPGDGFVTSFMDYDRNSRTTFTIAASPDSALEVTRLKYDGLSRIIRSIDAENNEVVKEYDKNSNVIKTISIDRNSANRVPEEAFATINVYDALNRIVRTTDNIGNTQYFTYDSRNLVIKTEDSQGSITSDPLGKFSGDINNPGNTVETIHDGLGRVIQTVKELKLLGQGENQIDTSNISNPDGKIIEEYVWNDNSKISQVKDDKGNTTTYEYDNLNRTRKTIFADTTFTEVKYDKDNNVQEYIDNNGSIHKYFYDGINRVTKKKIVASATENIGGTTTQIFEYDGLSRLTLATDNNGAGSLDNSTIERKYDSLSRLLEEKQGDQVVSYNWKENADLAECIYPNNRKLSYSFDKINRLEELKNANETEPLATFDYIGSRLLERIHGNGTKLTTLNDAGDATLGYDDLRRLTLLRYLKSNDDIITGYSYTYNREGFQLSKRNLRFNKFSELYKLDSSYRVTNFSRGELSNDNEIETTIQKQDWTLDGVGNWSTIEDDNTPKNQSINEMNEYSSFDGVNFKYDSNGNLTEDNQFKYLYDGLNRVITVKDVTNDNVVANYVYDVFNRRICKSFTRIFADDCRTLTGEVEPDANTLMLAHFNEESGPALDSSGNGNNINNIKNSTRVDGLFNTRALRINGESLKVVQTPSGVSLAAQSIDNIQNSIIVDAIVFLDPLTPEQEIDLGGSIIRKKDSFRLKINKENRKPVFTVYTINELQEVVPTTIQGDTIIPLNTWVHVLGVYNGQDIRLFVNGTQQKRVKSVSGNINNVPENSIFIGNPNLFARLEEVRISSSSEPKCFPGQTIEESVKRKFFYSNWTVIEEHEQTALPGQSLGEPKVTRQFVDIGIDNHLTMDIYNDNGTSIKDTFYFHANDRGDTVAITDNDGNEKMLLEYSTYGVAYEVNEDNDLEELTDFSFIVFGFHGRRIDEETGRMYFRHRYYDQETGRFSQRDPKGYVDSYGLYEAFAGNPYAYRDPMGLDPVGSAKDMRDHVKLMIKMNDGWVDPGYLELLKKREEIRQDRLFKLGFGHYHQALKNAEHALFAAKQAKSSKSFVSQHLTYTSYAFFLAPGYEFLKESLELFDSMDILKSDKKKSVLYKREDYELLNDQEGIYLTRISELDKIRDFEKFVDEYKKLKGINSLCKITTKDDLTMFILGDLLYRAYLDLGKNATKEEILRKAYEISDIQRGYLSVEVSLPEISSVTWAFQAAGLMNDEIIDMMIIFTMETHKYKE